MMIFRRLSVTKTKGGRYFTSPEQLELVHQFVSQFELETSYDGKDVLYISGGKNLQLFSIRGCYDDSCKPNINDCNFSSS